MGDIYQELAMNAYEDTLTSRWHGKTFESYDVERGDQVAFDQVEAWAKTFAPKARGLFLTGPVGTGKTHLAVAAGYAVAGLGLGVRFLAVPALIEKQRLHVREGGAGLDYGRMFDTVGYHAHVLDELGAIKPTEYVLEQAYLLIDAAYQRSTPVIVTSNLDYGELGRMLGERTVSRLVELTAKVVVHGDDYRLRGRGEEAQDG